MNKLLFLLLIFGTFSYSSSAEISDISNSICRVTNTEMYGTGWCFKEDEDEYFIGTAGHFTGGIDKAYVDLFHSGEIKRVPAKKVFLTFESQTSNDFAVLSVKKKDFGKYPPFYVLSFGQKDSKIIWSYGCPNGKWPTAFKGRILGKNDKCKDMIDFSPPVEMGRSGSPVFNTKGEIIGMVVMCNAFSMTLNGKTSTVPINGIYTNVDKITELLKEHEGDFDDKDSKTD